MDEIAKNFIIQFGSLGVMVIGLVWFSRTLFHDLKQRLEKLTKVNDQINAEFLAYLMANATEHHELIKKNTEAFTRLISFLEDYMVSHMKENTDSRRELANSIDLFVKELKNK